MALTRHGKASERIPTVRLDYGWNTDKHDKGFGIMSGFQWRELTLDHDEERTYYNSKENFSNQMLQTDHVPWLNTYPETFIGPNGYKFPWSTLVADQKNLYIIAVYLTTNIAKISLMATSRCIMRGKTRH